MPSVRPPVARRWTDGSKLGQVNSRTLTGRTQHWKHLRTTNPIESTFATVRLREDVTRGAGSRTAGLAMAFKLLQIAEGHWRRLDGAELVPLVRAGVRFEDGVQSEPQKKRKKVAT